MCRDIEYLLLFFLDLLNMKRSGRSILFFLILFAIVTMAYSTTEKCMGKFFHYPIHVR